MTTSPLTPSQGLSLRGWVDLTCGRETLAKKSIKFFEEALAGPENPKPVDALFGKARFYLMRYNFSHALEVSRWPVMTQQLLAT